MRRVAIVGCGGAGKSTLARDLGTRTGLPVVHLDLHFWNEGWIETPRDRWAEKVDELVAAERWVVDGNYGGTMERRLAAADTIIFLDFPRWRCVGRVLRRRLRYHGRTRPDLRPGCPERMSGEFLRYIWNYNRTRRTIVLERIDRVSDGRRVEILRSPRAVRRFLEEL
ncbi:MAG: DNA topology modulation protein [Planctomycetota bacterium]|jgi:adenylate kinase family enzyme